MIPLGVINPVFHYRSTHAFDCGMLPWTLLRLVDDIKCMHYIDFCFNLENSTSETHLTPRGFDERLWACAVSAL